MVSYVVACVDISGTVLLGPFKLLGNESAKILTFIIKIFDIVSLIDWSVHVSMDFLEFFKIYLFNIIG